MCKADDRISSGKIWRQSTIYQPAYKHKYLESIWFFSHDFRRHGGDGPQSGLFELILYNLFREPKISNFIHSIMRQNILSFKISVNDIMGMQFCDSIDDLFQNKYGLSFWNSYSSVDLTLQLSSVTVFHHYYAEIFVLVDVETFYYVLGVAYYH